MDTRNPHPTDVSDEEWAMISSYLELMPEASCQRRHASHDVFNALRYVVRSDIQRRMLPHDFPRGKRSSAESTLAMQHSPAAPHTAPDPATPATESWPAAAD